MRNLSMRHIAAGLLATSLAACAGGMKIQSEFDPATDFSGYQTFAWSGPQERTGDPRADNPVLDTRIRSAVEQQMTAIGLRRAAAPADIGVRYHVVFDDMVRTDTFNEFYAGVFRQTTTAMEYTTGTMVLDFYDPSSNELIWRGSAEAEVHLDNDPETQSRRINEAVRKMLEKYPR